MVKSDISQVIALVLVPSSTPIYAPFDIDM